MSSGSRFVFRQVIRGLLLAVLLAAVAGFVSAHAPMSAGTNEGIAEATLISSPEKSFVLYTELPGDGDVQYYLFPLRRGQILYGSLQVPGPDSSLPSLAILGPGIKSSGSVPPGIQIPAGSGAMMVQGTPPGKPSYEPFSPQPIYEVARFNVTAPRDGDYYLAVTGTGGKYSLAPGFREEFTAEEWLLIPWSVITIHLWEGQSPVEVFAPLVLVVIGGLVLFLYSRKDQGLPRDPAVWLILVSGLLYLGGAAMTGLQVIHTVLLTGYTPDVLVTLLFIAGPVILGIVGIRLCTRSAAPYMLLRSWVAPLVIGFLGLLFWAGLVIGPLLALAGSVLVLSRHLPRPGPG